LVYVNQVQLYFHSFNISPIADETLKYLQIHQGENAMKKFGFTVIVLALPLIVSACGGGASGGNAKADALLVEAGKALPNKPSALASILGTGNMGLCTSVDDAKNKIKEANALYVQSGDKAKADQTGKMEIFLTAAYNDCTARVTAFTPETIQKLTEVGAGADALLGR
jgi:hypothetical protein